jgi:hypothetical protein
MSVENFESRLGGELIAVGITGRLRRRIVAEFSDHLACDPEADLGDPRGLARQFADELGTGRARTAAVAAFAGLVVAGVLFTAAFLTAPPTVFGPRSFTTPVTARVAMLVAALACQIAFAAGSLAGLRSLLRRRRMVLAAAEAGIIVRRAAVGVGAGVVAMVSLGTIAVAGQEQMEGRWPTFTVIAAALGIGALAATVPSLWAAIRVRPVAPGPRGDLTDDLGPVLPAGLRGRPWQLAMMAASLLALMTTMVAVPAGDAFDGALRGLAEAMVCLAAFATVGRYLGLWGGSERTARG